ncbi:unnamed protein product [Timema podura]|uniref:Glycoside hydrolase family 38 N-terminal domain-containing protein n=1 Tax=Timema podura TaxID=61482 RepID=A0ABN7PE28_TIMPD|nr:unnamed protein product [Timema podura]
MNCASDVTIFPPTPFYRTRSFLAQRCRVVTYPTARAAPSFVVRELVRHWDRLALVPPLAWDEQTLPCFTSIRSSADLFTGVHYNHYSNPSGFCFDINCGDDPFIDNKRSPDYNVDEKVQQFILFVNNQLKAYTTDNIILTMGDDFNYQNAHMNFKNMDKLIGYVNALQANGSNINVFYSTPSCYLKALHDANQTWSVKEDDFFPYASEPYSYWTGYFTSRPTQKRFERTGNNLLQVN